MLSISATYGQIGAFYVAMLIKTINLPFSTLIPPFLSNDIDLVTISTDSLVVLVSRDTYICNVLNSTSII